MPFPLFRAGALQFGTGGAGADSWELGLRGSVYIHRLSHSILLLRDPDPPHSLVTMSVFGNTFTNSDVQQATFGAMLDRVTSGFKTHSLRRNQPDDEPGDGGAAPVDSRKQITELARTATRQSTATGTDMFAYQPGSDLDPYSPAFDAEKWTRGLSKLNREAGSGYTSGIAYRNLSVHGFGSDSGMLYSSPHLLKER